jgi:hypothetical protein
VPAVAGDADDLLVVLADDERVQFVLCGRALAVVVRVRIRVGVTVKRLTYSPVLVVMEEVRVEVPDGYGGLVADEAIQRGAIRSLAKKRLRELKADREEARREIDSFEEKYGTSFEEFEAELPEDTAAVHEDYNEWYFWIQTERRISDRIAAVRTLE